MQLCYRKQEQRRQTKWRNASESIANDGMGPLLSVSIGIAVYPHDGERIEALLRKADVAMYAMKAKKRELRDAR